MIRTLQSSWMTALAGGLIYLGVTFALITPAKFESALAARQEESSEISANDDPSWKFRNPELDQMVSEIKREKEALATREQQLQELALRLESERKELSTVTQTVFQLQADFDKNILRIKDQEMENIKRQGKVLSNMSPESSAALIVAMSEDEAVRVLFVMKTDDVSTILETMNKMGKPESRHAASLTEKLRRVLPPDSKSRSKAS